MSRTVSKSDVEEIVGSAIREAVDGLTGVISDFAARIDTRFDTFEQQVDTRFDAFGKRLDTLEQQAGDRFETLEQQVDTRFDMVRLQMNESFDAVDQRAGHTENTLDHLVATVDGFVKRLDDMHIENTARDSQYNRLVAWAKQVSTKTEVPLEY